MVPGVTKVKILSALGYPKKLFQKTTGYSTVRLESPTEMPRLVPGATGACSEYSGYRALQLLKNYILDSARSKIPLREQETPGYACRYILEHKK